MTKNILYKLGSNYVSRRLSEKYLRKKKSHNGALMNRHFLQRIATSIENTRVDGITRLLFMIILQSPLLDYDVSHLN